MFGQHAHASTDLIKDTTSQVSEVKIAYFRHASHPSDKSIRCADSFTHKAGIASLFKPAKSAGFIQQLIVHPISSVFHPDSYLSPVSSTFLVFPRPLVTVLMITAGIATAAAHHAGMATMLSLHKISPHFSAPEQQLRLLKLETVSLQVSPFRIGQGTVRTETALVMGKVLTVILYAIVMSS